jgi:hypothetical protein
MAILKNIRFANKELVTAFGKIHFDANGTADVEDSAAAKLSTLKGFSVVEEDSSDETENTQETKSEQQEDESEEVSVETTEEDSAEQDENAETAEQEDSAAEADKTALHDELEKMNVPQLKKYAKDNGIDIGSASKKDDIIAAIMA